VINYEYTEVNRIDNPHKYMYTSYEGSGFLDAYFLDRLSKLKNLQQKKGGSYKNRAELSLHSKAVVVLKSHLDRDFYDEFGKSLKSTIDWESAIKKDNLLSDNVDFDKVALSSFNIDNEINSKNLLISLLDCQLDGDEEGLVKIWIDRLVQRFEVTKKLYERYPVNFRKGEGKNDIVKLYWLFALSLTLFYCATKSIKYLSTLLKVTDLLCSLDEELLRQETPPQGLPFILLVELLSIRKLSKNIDEVNLDFA